MSENTEDVEAKNLADADETTEEADAADSTETEQDRMIEPCTQYRGGRPAGAQAPALAP